MKKVIINVFSLPSLYFMLFAFIQFSCNKREIITPLLLSDLESSKNPRPKPNLSAGLFAYYPFNGNTNDASGSFLHGTPQNVTLTTDRKGKRNAAYLFNNKLADARITIPGDARFSLDGDFTIAYWVLVTEFTTNNIETDPFISILYQRAKWAFNTTKTSINPLVFTMGFGAIYVTPQSVGVAGETKLNAWKHCIVSYHKSSGTIRYYFNGILAKEQTGLDLGLSLTDIEVTIGGNYNFTGLVGKIDEVRFYNRAITAAEASALAKL